MFVLLLPHPVGAVVAEQGSCILQAGQGVFAVLTCEPIRGAGQGALFALCVGNGFFLVCDQEFCSFLCCHHGAEVVLLLWLTMGLRASGVFPSFTPYQLIIPVVNP